jgi:hypothetical protein
MYKLVEILKQEYQTLRLDFREIFFVNKTFYPPPPGSYVVKRVQYVNNDWEQFIACVPVMSITTWLITKLCVHVRKRILTNIMNGNKVKMAVQWNSKEL